MNIDSPTSNPHPNWQRRGLVAALASAPLSAAWAQFRVEVSGVGLTQLPIALVPFRGEDAAPQKISAIIRADLERKGTPIGVNDLHIAGHARSEGLVLVTNNLREFERVEGLRLENWADGGGAW